MSDVPPSLRNHASDNAAATLQALTSSVDVLAPGVGSFFGALIGQVIPNQRADRFAAFVTKLGRRLMVAEGAVDELRTKYEDLAHSLGPEQRALFEDGATAATKATSDERIEAIVTVVAEGIAHDELRAIEQRRLLDLLSEITDEDIIVLCSYTMTYRQQPGWRESHKAVLEPLQPVLSAPAEEQDRKTLREMRTDKLLRLGVLVEKPTASGRSTSRDISPRGRFVLRKLGLLEQKQF